MVLSLERWVGTVAIVTGASAGIGTAIVEQLVAAGIKVVGLARRLERMEELSRKVSANPGNGKFYPVKCDMSKEEDILAAFKFVKEKIGPISILINNAGVIGYTNLVDGDTKVWKEVFDVNVIGLSIATREAVKDMRSNNIAGHIVHINSIAGHKIPYFPKSNVYPASKHAVTALTETLRIELNTFKSKIKVTSVSPGLVDTEIMVTSNFSKDDPSQKIMTTYPILKAEDVADAVCYTLSTPPHVQVHEIIIKPLNEEA